MKISTIRSLLILFDVVLLLGIVGVVYLGLKEKDTQREEAESYKKFIRDRLEETTAAEADGRRREEYLNIANANLSNKTPPKVEEAAPAPAVDKKALPPLGTLIELVGTEVHTGPGDPSLVFYQPAGSKGARPSTSMPAAPAGDLSRVRGGAPRPTTSGGAPAAQGSVLVSREGYAIEFGKDHEAFVKEVRAGEVVFLYDNQEVVLLVPKESAGTPGAAGGSAGTMPALPPGPVNPDPKTWISWNENQPQKGIELTPMGIKAFQDENTDPLQGVRFETERLENGQRALKLATIPQDSVLRRGGAEEGDIIIKINTEPVSSKADIIAYVKRNPNLPSYTVEFRRRGRTYTRTVQSPRR